MRKDWRYLIFVGVAALFYLAVKLLEPRSFDWTVTFHREDRDPYGCFALDQLIETAFPGDTINQSNLTLFELLDSVKREVNILTISTSFAPGKEDTDALLSHVAEGGTALISANYFYGDFADTLLIATSDYFFESGLGILFDREDSSALIVDEGEISGRYPRSNVHMYFKEYDTTQVTVMAVNDIGLPVTLALPWGRGMLILNSTPMIFTNIYLLDGGNHSFVERHLSALPDKTLLWTEFYHLGRLEAKTPLRVILTNEPLAWAYYILILSLLLFILFEAKRRQRIIPVIEPLKNSTLEFVRTIGNMHYHHSHHRNIAEKRINFLLDRIRERYRIPTNERDAKFVETLTRKSGVAEDIVNDLVRTIDFVLSRDHLTEGELQGVNRIVEHFSRQAWDR